jgi:hypothetical protein
LHQGRELDSAEILRLAGEIPHSPFHNRSHSNQIPGRMMVEGNRKLDHALQKPLLLSRRRAPHVFQDFVGFEEFSSVE